MKKVIPKGMYGTTKKMMPTGKEGAKKMLASSMSGLPMSGGGAVAMMSESKKSAKKASPRRVAKRGRLIA